MKKNDYIKPETMVCLCEADSLLAGSTRGKNNAGGDEQKPEDGGPGDKGQIESKSDFGSIWDFDSAED